MLDAYDFVIVGAGAAGSVIVSRLSENPRVTVLLIEAGGCENVVRVSVSKAYLEPVINDRPNLHILSHTLVTRVLISRKFHFLKPTAYGVEYRHRNSKYIVIAIKEVILCAGAIYSPQLLLLSGIGPRKQLYKFKIPVKVELNGVGQNLRDHPLVFGPTFIFPGTDESCGKYLMNRSGKLAHFDSQCLNAKSVINDDEDWNDIQLLMENLDSIATNLFAITMIVFNVRAKSVGYLELQSADPLDHPIIQPNYLTHPDDILVLIDGLRWAYCIAQIAIKILVFQAFDNLLPDCEQEFSLIADTVYPNMKLPCDDYLQCLARHMTSTAFHLSGTCKMGFSFDRLAVVNSRLQVLGGVNGLRVADTSVMPVTTYANTMAPTVMIGERAARFIKDDYRL